MIGPAGRGRGDRAQATVEVALMVPVIVLLALAMAQVGVLVHDQLLVTAAAREAARAAAVSPDDAGAQRALRAVGGLDPARVRLDVTGRSGEGSVVHVRVSYTAATAVPLIGVLLPDVVLAAEAAMRSEA